MRRSRAPRGVGIVLPGFLDSKDNPAIAAMAAALHEARFTAIAFDPRGTWASPGEPADVAPTTQLADIVMLLDAHQADRVVLVGHCYGAQVAALAAAADPRVTDVVALMPTRCFIWPEDYDLARDSWRRDRYRTFLRERDGKLLTFRIPHTVVDDALTHDLPTALRGLRQRILFVAGVHDELIGVDPVWRLYDGCGSPKKELAVLAVRHDYRDHPDQIKTVNRTVLEWLDR